MVIQKYNYFVGVVGWGIDPLLIEEYWIGRNSHGTYWGKSGFFKIKMHSQNLGIESNCSWAKVIDNLVDQR